jgi:hypothetical protein
MFAGPTSMRKDRAVSDTDDRRKLHSGWTHNSARALFGSTAAGFIILGISVGWKGRFQDASASAAAFAILIGVLVAFFFVRPIRPVWWDGDFLVVGRGPWTWRIPWLDVVSVQWPWWVTAARSGGLGAGMRLAPLPMEITLRDGRSILFHPRHNVEHLIFQAKQEARARADRGASLE